MTIMTDRGAHVPLDPTITTSATKAKLSAQPATSTLSPALAEQIDAVRAKLPATSPTCRYGSTGWLACHLQGEKNRPVTALELAIEGYEDGKPPVLVFCADGNELTVAQARAAVATVLDHLPRMLTMISQYDALLGGA